MNLPKSIRILGRKFTVRYVDLFDNAPFTFGRCLPFENCIEIATAVHKDESHILTTLTHEALHGCMEISGHAATVSNTEEERLVTMLTYAFEELMPQIVKARQEQKQ